MVYLEKKEGSQVSDWVLGSCLPGLLAMERHSQNRLMRIRHVKTIQT